MHTDLKERVSKLVIGGRLQLIGEASEQAPGRELLHGTERVEGGLDDVDLTVAHAQLQGMERQCSHIPSVDATQLVRQHCVAYTRVCTSHERVSCGMCHTLGRGREQYRP
jgi:hypothetical protein